MKICDSKRIKHYSSLRIITANKIIYMKMLHISLESFQIHKDFGFSKSSCYIKDLIKSPGHYVEKKQHFLF